jgi:peptidoglycan hydrolase CwlO-like protein
MRGIGLFLLVAVVVLLLGATGVLFRKYEKSTSDNAESQTRYNEAINAIAEIQDSLYSITAGDSAMGALSQGLRTEQTLTEPQTKQALEQISAINSSIGRTKMKIAELEEHLQKNGIKVAGLQRMITTLKKDVADKETTVSELNGRVDSLQVEVAGLQGEVQQSQETIHARDQQLEERRNELATIYFKIGTKKELKDSGLIVSTGGFLGMGKSVQLTGKFDENEFTRLDTDAEKLIHTQAAKARVLSAQPASSYELKLEGEEMELHILDSREFRKVKHLIIVTG